MKPRSDDLSSLGFNDHVELNGRSLHVQTEVTRTDPITVRSVVFEGGTILEATTRALSASDDSQARQAIQEHHENVLADVLSGRYT